MSIFANIDSVLIVGGNGLVGSGLVREFEEKGTAVWQTTRNKGHVLGKRIFLDLSGEFNEGLLPTEIFNVVVICAGVTSIKACKSDPVSTRQINVINIIKIAKYFAARNSFVIFLSTNSVFDGDQPFAKTFWPVNPQTEYGKQKAETEQELLNSLGQQISIVRFSKILSPSMPILEDWIIKLQKKDFIYPFSDMFMAPVTLKFATDVLRTIVDNKYPGIIHVSASQDFSYLQAAQYIAYKTGSNNNLIIPRSYKDSEVFFSPKNTTLDCDVLRKLGFNIPSASTSLDEYLKQK